MELTAVPTIVTSYLSLDLASSHHEGLRSRQLQKSERLLLKIRKIAEQFSEKLSNKLANITNDDKGTTDGQWIAFRDVVYPTTLQHLGTAIQRNQDWFAENNEEIQKLLCEKYKTFKTRQNDPKPKPREDAYKSIRNTVQKKLRAMHDYWLSKNSLILFRKKEKCHNIARH